MATAHGKKVDIIFVFAELHPFTNHILNILPVKRINKLVVTINKLV